MGSNQDLSGESLPSELPSREPKPSAAATNSSTDLGRPRDAAESSTTQAVVVLVSLGIVLIGILLLPRVVDWIGDRWNSRISPPDVLDKLIDERKSSQTIETEADRAEYEGRLEDAARLRQKAAMRRSEEQSKAAGDKQFQEWRRMKYGESSGERK